MYGKIWSTKRHEGPRRNLEETTTCDAIYDLGGKQLAKHKETKRGGYFTAPVAPQNVEEIYDRNNHDMSNDSGRRTLQL